MPLYELSIAVLSLSLFAAPSAISSACMKAADMDLSELRRGSARFASTSSVVRVRTLSCSVAVAVLVLYSLMFFIEYCGAAGLVLWIASVTPAFFFIMRALQLAGYVPSPEEPV